MRGAEALSLAREYHPTAVSLDVFLPDMLGWTVLSQLKQDPDTRHIPVQVVTLDEDRQSRDRDQHEVGGDGGAEGVLRQTARGEEHDDRRAGQPRRRRQRAAGHAGGRHDQPLRPPDG